MGQADSMVRIPPRKVIKTIVVGQEVEGVIKRVTDFGAFVDIGVGRDGLVHVSEMATGRVAKASDVVKEGDQVTVWIKELDRQQNRISLTMVAPGTVTVNDLSEGTVVTGKVTRIERYGAFVDIGVGRDGMLHVKEMGHGFVEKPESVVKIGDEIEVKIITVDRQRGRVDLSIKDLLPPPEGALGAESAGAGGAGEEWPAEEEEVEFTSPFELAFQEAQQSDKGKRRRGRKKKSRRWDWDEDEDEDIISRTFAHHQKNVG